jgi:putative FmdB family regulatory protein
MPTYEYECDQCSHKEEHIFTMTEVVDQAITCQKCQVKMRRLITGGSGTIFRGDGWVDKELRRAKEDQKIQIARRKAVRMKNSGAVPHAETIKIDQAEGMYDRLGTEVRKKEAEKAESGDLDKEMDSQISAD